MHKNFLKYNFCVNKSKLDIQYLKNNPAGWQSGYAAACKAVNAGSIPASASK